MLLKDVGLGDEAFDMLRAEDARQIGKWGYQEHPAFVWLAIVGEEVGGLNKAILEYELEAGSPEYKANQLERIEKEATQVAALAAKMAYMVRKTRESC